MSRRAPLAPVEDLAPFVEFDEVVRLMNYQHDEHVTLIGPTRRGKTTLALRLLELRRNVVIIGTKTADPTLQALVDSGQYVRRLEVPSVQIARRVIIWPQNRGIVDVPRQRVIITRALDLIFGQGNRTTYVDEVHYGAEFLHLAPRLKMFWTQGASAGLSVVAGFQRPAWVPRDAYSSATHLFLFGTADETDAKAIGGIGGLNSATIRRVIAWLAADRQRLHEFLYVNTRTGIMVRSRLRNPKGLT